jgi:Protein of unknown function (DUF1761)
MTWKRTSLAFVLIFVLTAVTNFLIHGMLLQGVYQQSAGLMREPQDGQSHAPFLLVAFFVFSIAFVWLYPQSTSSGSWMMHGLRYGVAVWLIATVSRYFIYYAIQPWPFSTVLLQLGYELVATLLLGVVLAFVASR